ncbi:hypothetical protein DFP72DRAFT_829270, partial [Ephemerocybe angulata]
MLILLVNTSPTTTVHDVCFSRSLTPLTARLEIGSPLACLYLLGFPDHYTSHKFVPFFWRRYVNRVIARSHVDDYAYRPECYSSVTLYDWIRYHKKRTVRKRKAGVSKKARRDDEEAEEDDQPSDHSESDPEEGWEDLAHITKPVENEPAAPAKPGSYHAFMPEHPLFGTHEVRCDFKKDAPLPTWLGGTVPRSDQGDREYYCMVMLTLFKPWRTGQELKNGPTGLWDDAFVEHTFSAFYTQVMKNMNLKYECLDARDDYHSQLETHRKKMKLG